MPVRTSGVARLLSKVGKAGQLTALIEYLTVLLECFQSWSISILVVPEPYQADRNTIKIFCS